MSVFRFFPDARLFQAFPPDGSGFIICLRVCDRFFSVFSLIKIFRVISLVQDRSNWDSRFSVSSLIKILLLSGVCN